MVTPELALDAAADRAAELGLECHLLSDNLEGEAKDVGIVLAGISRSVARRGRPFSRPCVLLSGGETTVTLPASNGIGGSGGRCSELLLAAAIHLEGEPNVWMLAGDTDGIDGLGDAAGAWVHPDTLARAAMLGMAPTAMLAGHESGKFFRELGDALVTGPTHTNVNDFRAIFIS